MPSSNLKPTASGPASEGFSHAAVSSFLAVKRPHRSLFIRCGSGALDDGGLMRASWSVTLGKDIGGDLAMDCRLHSLPFQSRVFDLVVVQHLLANGSEDALPGLQRVLKGGGHLLVLGAGRWSRRSWRADKVAVPVTMRPPSLCQALKSRGFVIESCEGMGLMGLELAGRGWSRPLVPFNDEVVIVARRHDSKPVVRPLRFAQPRAVGAQSTAMEAMRREELNKEAVA